MDYSRFTPYKPWMIGIAIGAILGALITGQPWIAFGVVLFWAVLGLTSAVR